MGILLQSLGIGMGAVYLAEEVSGSAPHLQEIFAYPDPHQLILPYPSWGEVGITHHERMVLPLLYENTLLGFLMIGRGSGEWTEGDLALIGKVATTLTIAVALDQRQHQLYQQQRDFLARLFHQLRNPLTAIRTFAQLLWRRLAGDSRNQPLAEHILTETAHLQDLLSMAELPRPFLLGAVHAPKLLPAADLTLTTVDIVPIVQQLARKAETIARERQLHFQVDMAEVPPVVANQEALREVLSNLLDNALKYTPPSGSVQLSVLSQNDRVQISIADTGIGIPPADRERLFTPYFRGQQANGQIEGTGLGLAIVADLVKQMAGTIDVESAVGQGSKFTVSLAVSTKDQ
jgi:signal transduction histidine kinase